MTTQWATISSLATAGGTLVLAVATFAAVRTSNKSARVAERAFQFGLRPLLAPSRLQDAKQKIMFADRHWVTIEGGRAAVEIDDGVLYMAMQVRNIGNGLAVIDAWQPYAGVRTSGDGWTPVEEFREQSRSLWVPPGDVGFWQGALRDENEEIHRQIAEAVDAGEIGVEILYRDHEGGQRTVSRFSMIRTDDSDQWLVSLSQHRSLDD